MKIVLLLCVIIAFSLGSPTAKPCVLAQQGAILKCAESIDSFSLFGIDTNAVSSVRFAGSSLDWEIFSVNFPSLQIVRCQQPSIHCIGSPTFMDSECVCADQENGQTTERTTPSPGHFSVQLIKSTTGILGTTHSSLDIDLTGPFTTPSPETFQNSEDLVQCGEAVLAGINSFIDGFNSISCLATFLGGTDQLIGWTFAGVLHTLFALHGLISFLLTVKKLVKKKWPHRLSQPHILGQSVVCCGFRKRSQKVTLPHTRRVLVNPHGPNQAIEIHCLDNQNFVQGVAGAAAAAADVQEFLPTVISAVAAVQALADSVTDEDILTETVVDADWGFSNSTVLTDIVDEDNSSGFNTAHNSPIESVTPKATGARSKQLPTSSSTLLNRLNIKQGKKGKKTNWTALDMIKRPGFPLSPIGTRSRIRQQRGLHPEEFPVSGSIAGFSPIRMGTDDNKE